MANRRRMRLFAGGWPGRLGPRRSAGSAARLAAALDYAHRRGVLHRDVKPANVLLAADGSPKLADFNVSFSSKLDGATPAAYFGGSLAYMSPEQLEASNPDDSRTAEELDGRSDIYSLAVLLWEMLTGARPFGEEKVAANMTDTLRQLAERRRAGVPESAIAALPRDMPPGLDHVLLSCLHPNASERPATGADVARQLELCLQPHVQRLLRPKAGSLRQMMRKYPIRTFVIAGALPHVVFSVISIAVNYWLIIRHLSGEARGLFWGQVGAVNATCYAFGVGLGIYLCWPVIQAVRGYNKGSPPRADDLPELQRRSLVLGDYVALIGFALWLLSGFVFPAWLHMAGHYDPTRTNDYLYFFLTQIICGLIASTQAFFMLTFVLVRGFHPLLIQVDRTDLDEIGRLYRLCAVAVSIRDYPLLRRSSPSRSWPCSTSPVQARNGQRSAWPRSASSASSSSSNCCTRSEATSRPCPAPLTPNARPLNRRSTRSTRSGPPRASSVGRAALA